MSFANAMEKATLDTIESGKMTGDLAMISTLEHVEKLSTEGFIQAVKARLDELLA